jgi:hypothetical protein
VPYVKHIEKKDLNELREKMTLTGSCILCSRKERGAAASDQKGYKRGFVAFQCEKTKIQIKRERERLN